MNILEYRKENPQFEEYSDQEIADALYQTEFSGDYERYEFDNVFFDLPQDLQVPAVPDTTGVSGVGVAPQAPQRRFTAEEAAAQGNEFTRSFLPGIDSLQAMGIGGLEVVGEKLGFDTSGLAEARKEQERQAAEYAPARVSSYTQIESGEDLFDYIASTVGGAIPATAAILGTASGVVFGAPALGASTVVAGGLAGATAFLGGSLIGAGDVYSTLLEEGVTKEEAADIAGIAGTAMGALELVPFASIAKNLAKAPIKEGIKKSALRKLAGDTLRTGAAESVTEAGQDGISVTAEAVGTGKTPGFEETKERLINAAIGGFLIGGPMGAGSGYIGEQRRRLAADKDPEAPDASEAPDVPGASEALLEEALTDPNTDIRDAITDDGASLASSIIGRFEKEGRTKLAAMGQQLLAQDGDGNYILSEQTARLQFAALGTIRQLNSGANANDVDPDFTSITDRGADGADVLLSPEGRPISGRYVSEEVSDPDAAVPIAGRVFVDPKQFPLSAVVHETIHHWDTVYSRLDPEAHKVWAAAFKPSDSFKGGLSDEVISIIGEETVNEFDAKLRGITMTQRELTAYAFQAHTEAKFKQKLPEQGRGILARGFKELSNYVGRVIGKFKGTPSMTQADAFRYVLDGKLTGDLQQIVADRKGGTTTRKEKAKREKKAKTETGTTPTEEIVNRNTDVVAGEASVAPAPTGRQELQIPRTGDKGVTPRQPTKKKKSLQFDSDLDLVAYMLRPGAKLSEENRTIYSNIAEDQGFSLQEVSDYGTQVSAAVERVLKDSDAGAGSIKIPDTRTKAPDVSEGLSADTTSYEDFLSEGRSSTTTTETTDAEGRTTTTVKETDAPPLAASRSGDVVNVVTPAGTQVAVAYEVKELQDLIPSQTDDLKANPAYLAELQPRDRTKAASQEQISTIARTLNPDMLVQSPTTDSGAPVIGLDNMVESGNGRILAIRKAAQESPDLYNAYKEKLSSSGYDIANFNQPVLVRVNRSELNSDQRAAFVRESNQRTTLGMSTSEQAKADADAMSEELLATYVPGDTNSVENNVFRRKFLNEVVGGKAEAAAYQTSKGEITIEGTRRIDAALMQYAYRDDKITADYFESADKEGRMSIGTALRDSAARWAKLRSDADLANIDPLMDTTNELRGALNTIRKSRASKQNIQEFVGQVDAFDGAMSELETAWINLFFTDSSDGVPFNRMASPKIMRERIKYYIDEANKSEAGPGLFADKPTPEQVLADALKIKPPPPDADTPQIRLGDMMEILDTPPESAGGFVDSPPSTESEYKTFAQSIIPMLEGTEAFTLPEGVKKATIRIVADYLDSRFGRVSGVNRSEENPENVEALAVQLADESEHAVRLDSNAATWYRDKVENAMKIASLVYPELATDVAASTQFRFILAITSNGAAVSENSQASLDLYGLAKENKSAGRDIMPAGSIKGGGKEAKAMRFAFDTYNTLTKQIGVDNFHRFLNTKFTVRDLESILKNLSDASGIKPVKVSGENADTVVYGSALFGPKIGNGFFQNLQGNFEPLTADRWWVRTWGRITGKLYAPVEGKNYSKQVDRFLTALRSLPKSALRGRKISILKKNKEELLSLAGEIRAEYTRGRHKDKSEINMAAKTLFEGQTRVREAPYSGGERNYMRAVVARTRSILEDRGIFLEPADIQALVWYPEKELYGSIFGVGSKRSAPTDYEIEFAKEALKYGVTEKQIQSAIRPKKDGSGRPNHLGIIKDTVEKSKAGGQRYPEPFGDAEKVSFVGEVEGLTTKAHQDVLGGDYSEIVAPLSDPSQERLGSRVTPSLNDSLKKFKVSQIDANGDVQVIEGEYNPEIDMSELHGASAAATNKISNPKGASLKNVFGLLNRIGSFDKTKFIAAVADPYNYLIKQGADAAYMHSRLAHNTSGTIGELIVGGLAKWTDKGFVERLDANGNPEKRFGIPDIIEPIASKYGSMGIHLWGGYVQAVRSRRLLEEGRENNLSPLEINELLLLGKQYPEFELARKQWVKFNDGILDIAVDSGYLSREEAEKWKEYGDYVPLYRIDDRATTNVGDAIASELSAGGIGRVTAPSQRLVGGKAQVNSIVPNMILNTEFLITKSMRNFAARKAVEELGPKTGFNLMTETTKSKAVMAKTTLSGMKDAVEKILGPGHPMLDDPNAVGGLYDVVTFEPKERDKKSETIHVRDKDADGNTVLKYYDISDPLLFDALTFVPSHKLGTFMKIMNWQRGAFSQMITKFPDFIAANFIRDTMSARAQYAGKHSQILGALNGVKESFKSEGVMREVRLNGGTAIGGYHTDNQMRRYKNMTGDQDKNHLVVTAKNTWALWDRVGEAFENANRVAVYNAAKNQGKSGFEAGFNSKDVLDFSLSGESQIMKYFITTVPFLNARIQGLYKFGRSGSKTFGGTGSNRANFYMWTGAYALAASALYAMNSEDERYQALSDTAKDMYLHFYLDNLPGVTAEGLKKVGLPVKLTIPKPFEVGFMGMTIPERLMQQVMEDDATAGDFGKSIAAGVTGVFKVNPFEAFGPVGKGLLEDQFNFNVFRWRDIVPTFSQKYSRSIPEKIFGSGVDVEGLAIKDPYASKLINDLGEATNFAPQRIKNALDSWFPKVGSLVMGVGDMFYRSSKGLPPVPRRFAETPFGKATYGRFVGREYSPYSEQERELRDLNAQISGVTTALRVQKSEGESGLANRIRVTNENKSLIQARAMISQGVKTLNNLTKLRQQIDKQNLPVEERLKSQETIDIRKMRLSQTILGAYKKSARGAN